MLKTLLITTVLLFGKVNASTYIHKEKPNKANETTVTLHGQYVLRDNMEPYFEEFLANHDPDAYSFDYTIVSANDGLKATFKYSTIWYVGNVETLHIAIIKNSDSYSTSQLEYSYSVDDNGTSQSWNFDAVQTNNSDTLEKLVAQLGNEQTKDSMRYHMFWVMNYYTLTYEQWEVFNCFYTMGGNYYMTPYDGYYTFVNPWTSFNNITYWKWPIQTLVDNTLYNELGVWNDYRDELFAYMYGLDEEKETKLFDSPHQKYIMKNNRIWINGFLPSWLKNKMDTLGVFGYIQPEPETYSFFEFFAGIMDAPIVMVSGLLDFELFGVYAFTALCGLMTVLLIVAIIKKVI